MIGTLPDEAHAQRLCDYLITQKIAAHAEQGASGAWQVWVEHDDQLDAGRAELEKFTVAPADPRYDSAAEAKRLRVQAEKAEARRRQNFRDVRTSRAAVFGRPTPVTVTIIFISVVAAALLKFGNMQALLGDPDSFGARLFRAMLFNNPIHNIDSSLPPSLAMFASIAHGQVWRMITPIFIHFGVLHLVFNMMWTFDLGRRIEPVRGPVKMVLLVIVIAAVSCCAEALWINNAPRSHQFFAPFGGMSGVVAGLFGYAWMCGYFRAYEQIGVTQYETGLMLGWLVICSFGVVGPIANAAHWGGLVVGMIWGAAPSLVKKWRR